MSKQTYLIGDGRLYKIGESTNPQARLSQLLTANPYCELICYGSNISENNLHKLYQDKRVAGEWFDLTNDELNQIIKMILGDTKNDVKIITYDFKEYIFNCGPYKDNKITDMTNKLKYDYCVERLNIVNKNTLEYNSLEWWVSFGYKDWWFKQCHMVKRLLI